MVEVLAMAAGFGDGVSWMIPIRREDTGETFSYFISNSADAAPNRAPQVYPGNTVFVPNANMVYMIGDFNRLGMQANITDQSTITMLQVPALAGSFPRDRGSVQVQPESKAAGWRLRVCGRENQQDTEGRPSGFCVEAKRRDLRALQLLEKRRRRPGFHSGGGLSSRPPILIASLGVTCLKSA